MTEFILSKTSLPNLHPAVVHFPIALSAGALLIDVVALFLSSREWIRKAAVLLWLISAAAAGVTFWSGRQAAETVDPSLQAQNVLAQHENFALYTLWFFGVYAVLRLLLQLPSYRRWVHALIILLALAGQALILKTADLGGTLVYKHAVGVQLPESSVARTQVAPADKAREPDNAAIGPIIKGKSISWNFGPGSEKRLAEFFEIHSGTMNSLQAKTAEVNGESVLSLSKTSDEPILLTFKPSYVDIQMEADLDVSAFKGKVALVHHVLETDYDFFSFEDGMVKLGRHLQGQEKSFGQKQIDIPSRLSQFKAVSAGTHFRGYVNEKLVVHGHGDSAAAGKAGILLDGKGTILLAQIIINPLE